MFEGPTLFFSEVSTCHVSHSESSMDNAPPLRLTVRSRQAAGRAESAFVHVVRRTARRTRERLLTSARLDGTIPGRASRKSVSFGARKN